MKREFFSPWFLLPLLCVAFFTLLVRNLQLDDALIYLRYLRNFHEGLGLVYNVGDRFNGLTSPLYTALTLLVTFVIPHYQIAIIGLSAFCLAAAALLAGRLFSSSTAEAVFTSTVIACCGYFHLIFGMETMLFLVMIGLALHCYQQESPWFVVVLALLVSTRSEGIFLAAPMAIDYLIRHRRLPDWRYLLCGIVIFITPFVFNQLYFGEFLPATGSAKIGQGKSGLWGENWAFFRVAYQFHAMFGNSLVAVLFMTVFTFYGGYVHRKKSSARLAAVFALLLMLFYAGLNIPNYPWYYAPFFYLMLIFTTTGVWRAGVIILRWQRGRNVRISATVGLWLLAGFSLSRILSFETPGPHQDYVNIGNWLHENTSPDASVAMVEIGTVGWYSRRPIVDILGLVNDHNADYIGRREFQNWIADYQPDHILRHEPIWGHEVSITLLEEKNLYTPVPDFNFPGYVLLAKTPGFNRNTAVELLESQRHIGRVHEQLVQSSDLGPPQVTLRPGHLFAHAPSSLSLVTENQIVQLDVSYGVEPGAVGLHHGICFEVMVEANQTVLMSDCIEADSTAGMHIRHQLVDVMIEPGQRLLFNNLCQSSCDYGWSFWGEIQLRTTTAN